MDAPSDRFMAAADRFMDAADQVHRLDRPADFSNDASCASSPSVAIMPYNGLLARLQLARMRPQPTVPARFLAIGSELPDHLPPMPSQIKQLVYHDIPLGSKRMRNALTGEPYLKFNGFKDRPASIIAEYLICIPADERRDILERILLSSRPGAIEKIFENYHRLSKTLLCKNRTSVAAGRPLVCDRNGVIHW